MHRRTFLQQSGQVALGSLAFGSGLNLLAKQASYDLGVQLYTLMAVIDQDTRGTLQQLADLGYKNIESAFSRQGGFYGQSAQGFASLLANLGLQWKAHHVIGAPFKLPPDVKLPTDENGKPLPLPVMRNLKENSSELIDEAAQGGIEYLVCANIPTNTEAEVAEAVEILTRSGEACKKAGLQLVYHNHDWEFKTVGNSRPYDVFLSQIPADLMKMELDLAWATKAGVDIIALFKAHPGRFPLWHVKDIEADLLTLQPVGQGVIPFKKIFRHAATAGLRYPMIEHDNPADGMASLRASRDYLQQRIRKNK